MPLPGTHHYVTLTGTFLNNDDTFPTGQLSFTLNNDLLDTTDLFFMRNHTQTVTLVNGAFSITLLATDDAYLSPTGWGYFVVENVNGEVRQYTIELPFTGGASQNLINIAESPTPVAPLNYYLSTPGAAAAAGGQYLQATSSSSNNSKWAFGPSHLNVLNFGADPTGATDSTSAIQAAINQATGPANPASNSRVPTTAVYLPTGTYKITSDLLIQSTQGFNFYGDGVELTLLNASGTGFTTAVLNIDGSYGGRYHSFTLKGDTTEQVTNGINLTWTTSASRSTTGNKFSDIRIRNLKFVTGFSMAGITNRQVDSTRLDCVVIGGGQTTGNWSNSGNWQKGFEFGNGTFANIYDQVLTRCDPSNVYYGFYNQVSSFSLNGSQPANNYCDFYMNPGAQSTVTNVQSQNVGQFIIAPSNFSPQPTSFNDCQVKTSFIQGPVIQLAGGLWNFNHMAMTNLQATSTVAAGSNGGQIANIATWSSPSAGVLAITNATGFPASGTITVATSTTTATVTYTGVSGNTLTGCAYVSGSATGLVATGGTVSASYQNGTISLIGAGALRPCVTLFNNLSMRGTRVGAFTPITNSVLQVNNYNNYEPTTGNYTYATGDVASLNIGGVWTTVGGPGTPPQVNYITATGTTSYSIPVGAVTLDVLVVGAGAGGSSGAFSAAGNAGGGAGGGGGGVSRMQFPVSALTSPVSVTVGVGGTGGAAVTGAGAGNSGGVGGSTTFGGYLWGQGGRNGSAGSATLAVSTGGAGGTGTNVSGAGGSTITTAGTLTGATAQSTGGGGAGGAVVGTTVAVTSNGGQIANIATWSSPSAGVLAVAAVTGFPTTGGTITVATSTTPATVTYTGVSGSTLTGCAYVSGSATGTVATGGQVSMVSNGAGCTAPSLGTSSNSSTGGVVGGASPTNGSAPAAQGDTAPGGAGGAGAAGAASSAQDGASARANSGGGGGGGGACQGGTTGGKGGDGGSGFAVIIAYFQ